MKKSTLIAALATIVILSSCANNEGAAAPMSFPKGFMWGVTTDSEQSEGWDTQNDWYIWEQMGDTPIVGAADNSYALYDEDSAEVRSLSLNTMNITVEWARIVPDRPPDIYAPLTGADVSPAAVQHYIDVVQSLIRHGITPVITLTMYTLPQWVDNPRDCHNGITSTSLCGWTSTQTAYAFGNYARFMAQQFSQTVKYWITENEPNAYLLTGYVLGRYTPGFLTFQFTAPTLPFGATVVDVYRNEINGHALAYHAIHDVEPGAMVSVAVNSIMSEPVPGKPETIAAARAFDHAYNLLYPDAVTGGVFDNGLTGTTFTEVHPDWAHTIDFLAMTYYGHDYVITAPPGLFSPINAIPCDSAIKEVIPPEILGCPSGNPPEPAGLTAMLLEFWNRYHLPIMIVENGSGSADPMAKTRYIVQNLMAVHNAISEGVKVFCYTYWTLNYDYEWTSGYYQNFGLFYVDDFSMATSGTSLIPVTGTDFTRTPIHPASDVYAAIAAADGISPTIIDRYGQ